MFKKKRIHYVVKVNNKISIDSYISTIKEYPSIRGITLNYRNSDKILEVEVLSRRTNINCTKLLSSITNYANSGDYEVNLVIKKESVFNKMFTKNILSIDMDYLGCIKNLRSSRNKQMI